MSVQPPVGRREKRKGQGKCSERKPGTSELPMRHATPQGSQGGVEREGGRKETTEGGREGKASGGKGKAGSGKERKDGGR